MIRFKLIVILTPKPAKSGLSSSHSLSKIRLFTSENLFTSTFRETKQDLTGMIFRVSFQAMINIRDNSTHWRVTCNFPSGLDFTDYPRATLQATDILTFVNQDRCRKYEYISVRGQSCTDCSGMIVQRDTQHMHTDSYWSGRNGCFWDPRIGSVVGEDNFGFYNTINTQHSCTENSLSITQWWLGAGL